ncbi:MAG: DUF2934 domain-containing protein [Candidatus Omnitrophica bacterium]|nr:DUF2934 domain-containing protein [Candidatus Omnitrophota bacterium]
MAIRTQGARTNGKTTAQQAQPRDVNAIARIAYALYERRGRAHGFDQQDWFEAEQIVKARQRLAS